MTGKKARLARASAARAGTVAADSQIDISKNVVATFTTATSDAQRTAAKPATVRLIENELAGLPLDIRWTETGRRVNVWRSADGRWWRRGGGIGIQVDHDGVRKFIIWLRKGANEQDIEFLLAVVRRARQGEGFDQTWQRITSDWADDLTFRYAYANREYVDPYTCRAVVPKVTPCDDDVCADKWHTVHGFHHLDRITKETSSGGHYNIGVTRGMDDDRWTIDIDTDEFYGTPTEVAGFVNDLQWMQQECERANAARAEAA